MSSSARNCLKTSEAKSELEGLKDSIGHRKSNRSAAVLDNYDTYEKQLRSLTAAAEDAARVAEEEHNAGTAVTLPPVKDPYNALSPSEEDSDTESGDPIPSLNAHEEEQNLDTPPRPVQPEPAAQPTATPTATPTPEVPS